MISLNLKELMVQKGLKPTAHRLERMGIPRHAANNYLYRNPKYITFEHLYTICLHLNVTPKELFKCRFTEEELPTNHPLWEWHNALIVQPQAGIRNLRPDQILQLTACLQVIDPKAMPFLEDLSKHLPEG